MNALRGPPWTIPCGDGRSDSEKPPIAVERAVLVDIEGPFAEAAVAAQAHFESTVQRGEVPEDIEEVEQADLVALVAAVRGESRSKARRLIEGGGGYVNGRKVPSFSERITGDDARDGIITLRAGKKKYHLVRIV